ncbi:MAG: geranylgeranyl reductase family protein [Bryobacteraceae bacterium]|nr:geranylgeranyl reductase family protein [Bryobacteraceae bacterium]MDW8377433.1 geranylgeranyl reductase family protein [Bryobacterales bacterium]
MAPTCWDVLVAGGGPAGSLTAYHLAKAGLRVAVFDLGKFPRTKACGGGVQVRTQEAIPFDWRSVIRASISSAEFTCNFGRRFVRGYRDPLVHCVLRSEFDNFLMERAVEAGAKLFEGVRVLHAEQDALGARVETSAGRFSARYVIGADGANSIVSRALNARSDFFWQAAVYVELPIDCIRLERVRLDRLRVDWGTLTSGYAWVFPKGDMVNIGAGCPAQLARSLKSYLKTFLETEGLLSQPVRETLRVQGHQLPTMTPRTTVARGHVLLVGDAAGFVEPLTGEGISYACHGARLLARTLLNKFGDHTLAECYREAVRATIGHELRWARRLLSFGTSFPNLFYWAFEHSEEVWHTFCRVLRGEDTFEGLRKKILGPFAFLGAPLDFLVRRIERSRLIQPQPSAPWS